MKAKALQVCGTGSGVGKSVIVSALCRIFLQDGFRVCPFKAQNMALNSFVTKEGGEMGRAQAVQAHACRIEPGVDMNPVLIKPAGDTLAQIIVRGKPNADMNVREYIHYKKKLLPTVKGSFDRLSNEYEVVVIEGAGSPAEINLKSHDIVNMRIAEYADAPVIIVGDIDKGGVFAWLIGTLMLLNNKERAKIKGFIINKFRGDKTLLKSGIDFLEKKTGRKVLGVLPHFAASGVDISIPEEDSLFLGQREKNNLSKRDLIHIAVVQLPHLSNFTDFDPLEREPDVRITYVTKAQDLHNPDVIIIPGTKNTSSDLNFLKKNGFAEKIKSFLKERPETVLIGICGGFQMLGVKIYDPKRIESSRKEIEGLGMLPVSTGFEEEKILRQVTAQEIKTGLEVRGYEIHHGRTHYHKNFPQVFKVIARQGKPVEEYDGSVVDDGRVWGTYIHGIFDADTFRREFLNRVRVRKGLRALPLKTTFDLDKELDKLAGLVRENINMKYIYKILRKNV